MGVRLIEVSLHVIIQDSLGLWIPESRSWIPVILSVELEFQIPIVNIRDLSLSNDVFERCSSTEVAYLQSWSEI